ncbi:MAG: gfo/Idh/MocA family oxidoreductase, partial [Bacteroidota bacterium]
ASEAAVKEQCTIVGSKGRLRFSFFTSVNVELENKNGTEHFDFIMPQHIQMPLIQTILDDLRGTRQCPSTGISAARTNWVLEQISSSLA